MTKVPRLRGFTTAVSLSVVLLFSHYLIAANEENFDPLTVAGKILDETGGPATSNWKYTLILLRYGDALRLNDRKEEAVVALKKAAEHNGKFNDDFFHDEIAAEFCRLFALLGETEMALAMAKNATTKSYEMLAILLAVQALNEKKMTTECEEMVRGALVRIDERQLRSGDEQWLRAMAGHCVDLGLDPLAHKIIGKIDNPFWKSAALAEFHDEDIAASCPDVPQRVLALARAGAVESSLNAALEISNQPTRDEALRAASRILTENGSDEAAAQLAAAISDPAIRLLATASFLNEKRAESTWNDLKKCPKEDQPLLTEALAVAAGKNGFPELAMRYSEQIPPGPDRFRALDSAVTFLIQGAEVEKASLLLSAAEKLLTDHPTAFGRDADRACLELAVRFHAVGDSDKSSHWFERAKPGTPAVEAALIMEQPGVAGEMSKALLAKSPEGDARDRLVNLLLESGDMQGAVEAAATQPFDKTIAGQLFAVRLLEAGALKEAATFMETLAPVDKAEALIGFSISRRKSERLSKPGKGPLVGVSAHGSWRPWFPRLERLGIDWEAMSFLEPFERGSRGMNQKYRAVGFPGGNSHQGHTSVTGVEAVRGFIDEGGGFVGICAGQFLATHSDFIPMDEVYHPRGSGPHQVSITKQHPVAHSLPPVVIIKRQNGGFLDPGPGCSPLGWYDNEERYAALAAADRWDGRVVVFSPHPEGSSGFDPRDRLCNNALRWVVWGTP